MSIPSGNVPRAINHDSSETTFDIVAVPAIGADACTTWSFSDSKTIISKVSSWDGRRSTKGVRLGIGASVFKELKAARVYLYDHPPFEERYQYGTQYYLRHLLNYVLSLPDLGSRPISFVAHSTGGLLVKSALAKAFVDSDESQSCWDLIRRCFSVSFFGVPHYGSTILSEDGYQESVAAALSLSSPMPSLLRQELAPDNLDELNRSSREFVAVSNRLLKIWTFVEGEETTVFPTSPDPVRSPPATGKQNTRVTTFFKTPVVDRRSATLTTPELEFGVEEVLIVNARHAQLANFGDLPESITFKRYLQELTKLAHGLSGDEARDLEGLADLMRTDVHLFYEGIQQGKKRPVIKLWSVYPSLSDLCEKGPNGCLEARSRHFRVSSLPAEPDETNFLGESLAVPKFNRRTFYKQLEQPAAHIPGSTSGPSVPEITIELVDDDDPTTIALAHGEQSVSVIEDSTIGDTSSSEQAVLFSDPFSSQIEASFTSGQSTKSGDDDGYKPAGTSQPSSQVPSTKLEDDLNTRLPLRRASKLETESARSSRPDTARAHHDRRRSASSARIQSKTPSDYHTRRADTLNLVFPEFNHKKKRRWGSISDAFDTFKKAAHVTSSEDSSVLDNPEIVSPINLDRHNSQTPQSRRDVKAEALADATVVAPLPSKDRIKFRWIHVPMNHMLWTPAVFRSLAAELNQPSLHRVLLHRQYWNALQHVPRHQSPHGRFMIPSCNVILPKHSPNSQAPTALPSPTEDIQMSLFFPYLHWDTFLDLQMRSRVVDRRSRQERAYPVKERTDDDCGEHKLIWWHLTNASDLPLHIRRSLDQYGYPQLANTKARDMDQVLHKRTRPRSRSEGLSAGDGEYATKDLSDHSRILHPRDATVRSPGQDDASSVLMVDSLWLWITDVTTVVTFFPSRKDGCSYLRKPGDTRSLAADVRDNIYNDVNGDPQFARQCRNCFDFAALSVLHATTALLESSEEQDLQVFRIFEEYLSVLTEHQTKSFKEFRDSQWSANSPDDEQSLRTMLASLHNHEDLTALLELRDIEDELRTLDKLFTEQLRVIDQMLTVYGKVNYHVASKGQPQSTTGRDSSYLPPLVPIQSVPTHSMPSPPLANAQEFSPSEQHISIAWLLEAQDYIRQYIEQSRDMQKRCESVQEAYKLLLDMKQKQANVAEASLSRLAAQVASEQNRAIMIFTIFTIIFLPLSFFTSLFGMNTRQWSGVVTNPSFHEIFLTGGLVSVAIIGVALTMAFNRPIRHSVVTVFRRGASFKPVRILMVAWRRMLGPCFGSTKRRAVNRERSRWDDVETDQGIAAGASDSSAESGFKTMEKYTNSFGQTKMGWTD